MYTSPSCLDSNHLDLLIIQHIVITHFHIRIVLMFFTFTECPRNFALVFLSFVYYSWYVFFSRVSFKIWKIEPRDIFPLRFHSTKTRVLKLRWQKSYHSAFSRRLCLRNFGSVESWIGNDTDLIFFQPFLIIVGFEGKCAVVVLRSKMDRTNHWVSTWLPFLLLSIYKLDPFSSLSDGLRSCVIVKGGRIKGNTFLVVFHVAATIHDASLNHFQLVFGLKQQTSQTKTGKTREKRSCFDVTG
jgi:hypothetical protein